MPFRPSIFLLLLTLAALQPQAAAALGPDNLVLMRIAALDIWRLQRPGLPCRDVVCFDLDLAWS